MSDCGVVRGLRDSQIHGGKSDLIDRQGVRKQHRKTAGFGSQSARSRHLNLVEVYRRAGIAPHAHAVPLPNRLDVWILSVDHEKTEVVWSNILICPYRNHIKVTFARAGSERLERIHYVMVSIQLRITIHVPQTISRTGFAHRQTVQTFAADERFQDV